MDEEWDKDWDTLDLCEKRDKEKMLLLESRNNDAIPGGD